MLVESFKPENFPFLDIPLYFPTHLRQIHSKTHTLLLRICMVNCDWSLTADVTEIFSRLRFADGFPWRVKLEPKKTDALAGYVWT